MSKIPHYVLLAKSIVTHLNEEMVVRYGTDPGISLFEDRVNSVRSSTSFHFLSQKNMCFFPSPNVSVHVAAVQQEAVLHAYILRTMWSISPWGLKKPRQQQT